MTGTSPAEFPRSEHRLQPDLPRSEHRLQPDLPPQKVTVLGAGVWGIVLASHLARKGHVVRAWDVAAQVVERLRQTLSHPKLPGFRVADTVQLTTNLGEAVDFSKNCSSEPIGEHQAEACTLNENQAEACTLNGEEGAPRAALIPAVGSKGGPDCVVVAAASHGVRALAEWCRPPADQPPRQTPPWVVCSKGIEEDSLLPMAGVIESVWGAPYRDRIAVLSGPSFTAEVARQLPTTVCAASTNPRLSEYVQTLFMTNRFRVYTQDDVLGVELGGSLKNVIAIAAGVCDGMELGDNARAALITRGLAEMIRLGTALGARPETFAGLAGMGDLILTCCGSLSRNHTFGTLLARGRTVQEALAEIGMVVEGMRTARSARALALKHEVTMPIVKEVYAVLHEGKSPQAALQDLMGRGARPERD